MLFSHNQQCVSWEQQRLCLPMQLQFVSKTISYSCSRLQGMGSVLEDFKPLT